MDEIIKQAADDLLERARSADTVEGCELFLMSAVRLDFSLLSIVPAELQAYKESLLVKKYNERMTK